MSTQRLSSAAALLGAAVGAFLPFPAVPAGASREPRPLTSILDLPDTEQTQTDDAARAHSTTDSGAASFRLRFEPASP